MSGYIDLHSHVLPGLDDGAATIEESVALARALAASGVRTLAATPHCSDRYPTTPAQLEAGLAEVRTALTAAGIELELVAGAEVALERLDRLDAPALRAFTLGSGGKYLLVEFPYDGWPAGLANQLDELAAEGVTAVLAHPERNPQVQAAPQRLAGLVDAGALLQVNAGALVRGARGTAADAAQSLLGSGLVHLVASDSHRPGARPTIADAAANLPGPLAGWLSRDVPRALLDGRTVPPPPPRRPRRPFFAR